MMESLASLAESRIQEALELGEDQRLSCAGAPIDLEAYFAAPSSLRAGFGVLKSAGLVPPEVDAMREIGRLRERLGSMAEGSSKQVLLMELQTREVELAMGLERMKRQLKADVVQ